MTFPQTILPIKAELSIDSVWTDITSYVQRRGDEGIEIKRGRADESANVEPSQMRLMLNNRDGRFSPRNPTGPYYGLIGRNTPIRVSLIDGSYLGVGQATGTTVGSAYLTTPDAASLDITGDIDIRFDANLNSWREYMDFVSKWTETGNQRSYRFNMNSTGNLVMGWSADGIVATTRDISTIPIPVMSGRIAVRATLDVNNGAGGRTTTFYTAPTIAGPWTQLGDPVTTTGVVSIFSGTAALRLLDNPDNTVNPASVVDGRVYAAQVLNGIAGTVVANPDFTIQADGTTSFADTAAVPKTWTLVGTPFITTRDPRFTGEVTNWPQRWDSTGTDVWVPLEASGVLRRLGQGAPELASPLKTGISNLTGVVAYWPLEDLDRSTTGASALDGGFPMKALTGTPDWAADDSFICSDPVVKLNNAAISGNIKSYSSTNIIQLRFLLHVVTTTTDAAVIARINTTGTAARWDLLYGTGGVLFLRPFDSEGTLIAGGMGAVLFNVDGAVCRLTVGLVQNGSDIDWTVERIDVGDTSGAGAGVFSGTVSSRTVGRAKSIVMGATADMDDVGIGHVEVTNNATGFYTLADQLNAFIGESAGRRFERLCGEQGVAFTGYGDLDDSPAMGAQLSQTFLELLAECATVDLGIMGEARDSAALTFRPATDRYRRDPDLTLDYTLFALASLEPEEDDQAIRNDVTVSRPSGSSARAVLSSGALSVNPSPDGVGRYDTSVTINVASDDQLPDQAQWRVRLGTIDEARYPVIGLNLAHPSFNAAQTAAATAIDVGSRVVVTNPPSWLPPDQISQAVQGYTEFLSNYERTLNLNCSPNSPADTIGFWGSDAAHVARYDTLSTTLDENMTTTETGMNINVVGPLWVTTAVNPDQFPFDIIIAGERMTVTAIVTTAATKQTMTVIRSVNGVVKEHFDAVNDPISLFQPSYYTV